MKFEYLITSDRTQQEREKMFERLKEAFSDVYMTYEHPYLIIKDVNEKYAKQIEQRFTLSLG